MYKSKEFKEDLARRQQTITYSGVGAHGQNGVSERGIPKELIFSRTMMLHQALMWPEHFDMRLWPFALSHAAYLLLPNRCHGLCPLEIYTASKVDIIVLRSEKTRGCPTYVLDPKIQDGKKLPK